MLTAVVGLAACQPAPEPPPPAAALAIRITGVEIRDQVGEEPWGEVAAPGADLVIVRHIVTNEGAISAVVGSSQLWLIAPNGDSYAPEMFLRGSYLQEDGVTIAQPDTFQIGPGLSMADAVVYQIPEGRFDATTWSLSPEGSDLRVTLDHP